jgi:hypothetical protein
MALEAEIGTANSNDIPATNPKHRGNLIGPPSNSTTKGIINRPSQWRAVKYAFAIFRANRFLAL